jgi:hypothetical protein
VCACDYCVIQAAVYAYSVVRKGLATFAILIS